MKFGFVSLMDLHPWGGSEELWQQAALRLLAQGHEVHASIAAWGDAEAAPVRALEQAGATVWRRRKPPPPTFTQIVRDRLKRKLGWVQPGLPGLAEFATEGFDLAVLSHGGGFPGRENCGEFLARSIPFVSLFQAASEQWWPHDGRREESAAHLRAARANYFVSHANLVLVNRQLGVHPPLGAVVRNPFRVPHDRTLPWPEENGPRRLAFVGRLEPGPKGCDILIETLAQPRWHERDFMLSFFGAGHSAQGVRDFAAAAGLARAEFHGHVPDVTAIWKNHHALVLPSRFEGLPIAVVEAMLCGRPCIVTDVAGNAELMEDNVSGFVAAAPTVRHLDEALERAWAARADWHEIGARAASAARGQIPADPAANFAAHLLALVGK